MQLLVQGLDPGEEGAAAAEGARDEAGLQVHGAQEGRQVVITILFCSPSPVMEIYSIPLVLN